MIIIFIYLILWILICTILIGIIAYDLNEEYKKEIEKLKNDYSDLQYSI